MNMREFPQYIEDVSESSDVRLGSPLPLGATQRGNGVNFALFSRNATKVWLELFDGPKDETPSRKILLDAKHYRTGDVWHIWIAGIQPGQLYGYRVAGPFEPENGHRFNPKKLLLDPCAQAISGRDDWDFAPARGFDSSSPDVDLSFSKLDDAGAMPKSIFTHDHFDWEGDQPLHHPASHSVIYEVHVRGFTIHSSSDVDCPGTYRGLIQKIPYLKDLGITAVELMPVQEFNENMSNRVNPLNGEKLKNYWGYDPVSFFAPKASYSSAGGAGQQKLEFKEMIKAFHEADIEIILDVVFNHTAEGNQLGPTIFFRGLDNDIYYILDENKRYYRDYTGTGQTIDANHPVVRDMILGALRNWVVEMHVDGFRFDLASVLGRDEHGKLMPNAPLLERIAEDPILRETKIIAEAWDAGGAYQVGSFSERRWAEWNGRYRDDVRQFWRGDPGMMGAFASRICGSADIYERSGKGPESSINFITSHDGFTLNDLVSYAHKHNIANGENNRDGMVENFSGNYGAEGETENAHIDMVRERQIKNFILTLFVSRGIPMMLGGDEFRRTQRGNNNAYCQDNEISWHDWTLISEHQNLFQFTRGMIAFRQKHVCLTKESFYSKDELRWFNPIGSTPNWFDPNKKQLACLIMNEGAPELFIIFNAARESAKFRLPALPNKKKWGLAADTVNTYTRIIKEEKHWMPLEEQGYYDVGPLSSVILVSA